MIDIVHLPVEPDDPALHDKNNVLRRIIPNWTPAEVRYDW
jgi:hypothetical protein